MAHTSSYPLNKNNRMSTNNNEPSEELFQQDKDVRCLKDTLNAIDRSTKRTQKLVKKALKLIEKVDMINQTLQIQAYTDEKLLELSNVHLEDMKHLFQEDTGETNSSTSSNYNLRKKRRLNYKN